MPWGRQTRPPTMRSRGHCSGLHHALGQLLSVAGALPPSLQTPGEGRGREDPQ